MLDKIEVLNIAENKEFDGSEIFTEVSNQLNAFAFAIHQPLKEKYPKVFEMTEDEYKEVQEEIEDFISSPEAKGIKEEFEAKALTTIATVALKGLMNLKGGEAREFVENFLEKELEKYASK